MNCVHPRKGESLTMQRSGIGNVSARGMQLQAVNGVAVGKVLTGAGDKNTDERQQVSMVKAVSPMLAHEALPVIGVPPESTGVLRSMGVRLALHLLTASRRQPVRPPHLSSLSSGKTYYMCYVSMKYLFVWPFVLPMFYHQK